MLKIARCIIQFVSKRKAVSVSLPVELLEWIEKEVGSDLYLRDRSHLIEIAVSEFKERRDKKNQEKSN